MEAVVPFDPARLERGVTFGGWEGTHQNGAAAGSSLTAARHLHRRAARRYRPDQAGAQPRHQWFGPDRGRYRNAPRVG